MKRDTGTLESRVYLVGAANSTVAKIGTSVNVPNRLKSLRTSSAVPLTLLASAPGASPLEKALHERFAEFRIHGEWFDFGTADRVALFEAAVAEAAIPATEVRNGNPPTPREDSSARVRSDRLRRRQQVEYERDGVMARVMTARDEAEADIAGAWAAHMASCTDPDMDWETAGRIKLVTEALVDNAVIYGACPIRAELVVADCFSIALTNHGVGRPQVRERSFDRLATTVDRYATSLGVVDNADGSMTVTAELPKIGTAAPIGSTRD